MVENRFSVEPDISVATVNEGRTTVFVDTYTDEYFTKAINYPEQAYEQLDEIMNLPNDANYTH